MKQREITRRQLLATSGNALAGLLLPPVPASGRSHDGRGAEPGFRLGVCDWTIARRTDPGSFAVAKRIGVDGVQVDFGGGATDPPLLDPELRQRCLAQAEAQGQQIASLALGVLNTVPYKSDARAERWVDQAVDAAQAMGQSIILLAFFARGDLMNDRRGTDAVVSRLKNVAGKAERAGVTLGLESWLDARGHMAILDRVASPAIQVYYDVANSHKMGYDIYREIRTLGKRICQFHAKDYDGLYGKGSIDFRRVRQAMDHIGYRGWLVMEGTRLPLGVEESCRYDAEYLRRIFPRRV